ncbi:probable plastid-lipid-associated protein 4, chloroplastic isoform X4 [Zingiber officinale]|uniref:probable plastid-lipid-associated protein 4, chloroplastic isoform X4 n=1 Tax=Zingiber officinale TaxID=94328 RepID=UPI001C4D7DFB|nr:probable plastid-lipid-associated protein 4, chloroplastic isoform X4 [Zingiber officinale]
MLVAMAFAPAPIATPSASIPTPRSLFLCHPQLPSPLFSSRLKETSVAAPLELSSSASLRWRTGVSFFPSFLNKKARSREEIKEELLAEIAPLDRGAEATDEDKERIDQIACEIEAVNPTKEPLKSDLLNGKWELIYTTSRSILQVQVTANLIPLNARRVKVQFDTFKILGLIPIKAPGRASGELEITYLDEMIRVSRGDKGNLFILKMVDRSYRVPL